MRTSHRLTSSRLLPSSLLQAGWPAPLERALIARCRFPILFLFGPEGFSHLTLAGSHIAHSVADLLSKNLWGWLGWYLRYKVKEHIIIHGDLRKKTKVSWLGQEMEVEGWVDEDEAHDPKAEVVRHSTQAYKRRASFNRIRDRVQKRGIKTRASFDADAVQVVEQMRKSQAGGRDEEYGMKPMSPMPGAKPMSPMPGMAPAGMLSNQQQAMALSMAKRGIEGEPNGNYWDRRSANPVGQVASLPQRCCCVVAATDESMIRFFEMQLELLPTAMRTESVISDDGLRQILSSLSGQNQFVDVVLMQPAFAQAFPGAIETVQSRFGIPVVLFGTNAVIRSQYGALDHMEGPSYGSAFRQEDLIMAINKWHDSPYRPMVSRRAESNPVLIVSSPTPYHPSLSAHSARAARSHVGHAFAHPWRPPCRPRRRRGPCRPRGAQQPHGRDHPPARGARQGRVVLRLSVGGPSTP